MSNGPAVAPSYQTPYTPPAAGVVGTLLTSDGSNTDVQMPQGDAGQVLTSGGAGVQPAYETPSGGGGWATATHTPLSYADLDAALGNGYGIGGAGQFWAGFSLKCLSAEGNYLVGSFVLLGHGNGTSVRHSTSDATGGVSFTVTDTLSDFEIHNLTSGAAFTPTGSKWQLHYIEFS